MWEGRFGGSGRGGKEFIQVGVNMATHTFGRNLLFYFFLAAVQCESGERTRFVAMRLLW